MHKSTERLALMEELQERGLGDVKKSPRRGLARARRRNSATIAAHAWPWPLGVSPAISFKPEWHTLAICIVSSWARRWQKCVLECLVLESLFVSDLKHKRSQLLESRRRSTRSCNT